MSMRVGVVSLTLVMTLGLGLGLAPAQDTKTPPEGINKSFENPDVKEFVKRFENEDREVYAKRQEIVDAIGLTEGMRVADVGAGTGIFTQLFAEKVGPAGKVYAVDISDEFLTHIASEAKKQGHEQIRTVKGDQKSTHLPKNRFDVVFMCDAYHHLENPDPVLMSIHEALKPSGRLVIVEYDRQRSKRKEFTRKHIRADKEVFIREIQLVGFVPIVLKNAPELEENFMAGFKKLNVRPRPRKSTVPEEPKIKAEPDARGAETSR